MRAAVASLPQSSGLDRTEPVCADPWFEHSSSDVCEWLLIFRARRRSIVQLGGTPGLSGTAIWPARPEERPTPRSGASDWDGDELRHVIRLQPHQHGALAIVIGVAYGIAHVSRGRNCFPTDIEDDVAALEIAFGGKFIRVDLGHDHPFRATASVSVC